MKNILLPIFIGLLSMCSLELSAQVFCGTVTQVAASGPDKFAMRVDLSADVEYALAPSNIVFEYNTGALANPTLVSVAMNETFYPTNVTNPNDPNIGQLVASINIDYLFPAGNAAFDYTIGLNPTEVATIEFDIIDPSQSSTISYAYNGGTDQTVMFATGPVQIFAGVGCLLGLDASLPVQLSAFNVNKKGEENALVTWQTSSEANTSHFDVERSLDNGKNWEKVGMQSAQGFSTNVNNYQFEDKNLKRFVDKNQLVYYRLKSVDFDLSHQLSQAKNISIELETVSISIYPNPTVEGVNVTVHSKDKRAELTAVLKDLNGRTIFAQSLGNDKMINQYLNFSDLSSGTYFMTVQSDNRVYSTEKLIILDK